MSPESKYLYVFFDADREALAWELPEPLEFAGDADGPPAYVAIGDGHQPPKNMAPFHEGIVAIKARYQDIVGWYIPYIWVSNEESMLNGRVYGWPKQLCDDDPLVFEGNEVYAEVNRRDQPLLRATFSPQSPPQGYGGEAAAEKMAELKGSVPNLQLKKVQSPATDGKVLRQLVTNNVQDFQVDEIWEGNARLEIAEHASYPHMAALQPTEVHSAFYLRPNFVLSDEGAEIVYEEFA